ncbi:MAG TPA: hypothetical protein VK524_27030 [Polyangiaceae bacterium]|nr:hypothetical protein [Polyangiaceae bacterium]
MSEQYSVVRFSPTPEQTEHVNVALLFSDPRFGLVYDQKFPKLTCIAPDFDKGFLIEYLMAVVATAGARDFSLAATTVRQAGAQFQMTRARELSAPLTAELVQNLTRVHLSRAKHTHKGETSIERRRIERKLDVILNRYGGADHPWIKKHARPSDYLTEDVRAHLKDERFRISRVVSTQKQLIAIDGLDIRWESHTIERRALAISFAFDMLTRVKELVQASEQRDLYLGAVILGDSEPSSAKQDHAIDILRRYSNAVVSEHALPRELSERLRSANNMLRV